MTAKCIQLPMKRPGIKIMGTAMLGTVVEIGGLFLIPDYSWYVIGNHLLLIPFMFWFLTKGNGRLTGKAVLFGYFWTMVFNGVVEWLWNCFGVRIPFLFYVITAFLFILAIGAYLMKQWRWRKGIYDVEITHSGVKSKIKGYYDTGNLLKDPYTGTPVHIISEETAEGLHIKENKGVSIPYQALGIPEGRIWVYYVNRIEISTPEDKILETKVPVAVAENRLFQNKHYDMILNENLWKGRGGEIHVESDY